MNQIVLSTNEIMTIAKSFADSGMFPDCKSMAQAAVKIQAGREFGIQPFAAMSGIHIIQGKPTIGAGLMAARVKGFGKYDYKVIEHNDKICSIEYFEKLPGNGLRSIGVSTFTIEDARKAGTKNLDKFPKNMLFARAMSNGVKWFTPDIYEMPVYVPEEMAQVIEDVQAQVVETPTPAPKQRTLNDEQFQSMMLKIRAGEFLKDGVTLVRDWAVDNVHLTPKQIAQFTPMENLPSNNNDFEL
jgi:hypothetical protein